MMKTCERHVLVVVVYGDDLEMCPLCATEECIEKLQGEIRLSRKMHDELWSRILNKGSNGLGLAIQ